MPSLRRFVNLENIQRRDQLAIARHDTFWGSIVVQVQRLFYGVDPDSHPLTDEQFTLAPAHNIIVSVSFHGELYPSFATYFKNKRICHSSLEILDHIGIRNGRIYTCHPCTLAQWFDRTVPHLWSHLP